MINFFLEILYFITFSHIYRINYIYIMLFQIPTEILSEIYLYDDTFKKKYNDVIFVIKKKFPKFDFYYIQENNKYFYNFHYSEDYGSWKISTTSINYKNAITNNVLGINPFKTIERHERYTS